MGRLPEEKGRELMMMRVFIGFAEILLGVCVKSLLAAERAEIIGLPVVFRRPSSGGGINIHMADGVMYGGCHKQISFPLNYAIKRRSQREPYY